MLRPLAIVLAAFVLAAPAPAVAAPCAGFTDVDDASPFCVNVAWMKNRGITLGCTATLYCPGDFVTRLQMAAFMYRLGVQNAFLQGGNAYGATAVLGTTDSHALELRANGSRVALFAPDAISPNITHGPINGVLPGVRGAAIGGGGATADPLLPQGSGANLAFDVYGTVGGGIDNRTGTADGDVANAVAATVAGGASNRASGSYASIGGGRANQAVHYATIGGGSENSATAINATVSGGLDNVAQADAASIGGGQNNTASGVVSRVGGGWFNAATFQFATVGGGANNQATGVASTIAGGDSNDAGGNNAAVGGGRFNAASGFASSIPGGADNVAAGNYSVALGRSAQAGSDGCFVFSDASSANPTQCGVANAFVARAKGGFYMITGGNFPSYSGAYLAPGAGAWTVFSDRRAKDNVAPVDARAVLDRVVALPIATWNYRTQDPAIRHLGPMAQDFHAAFGLGESPLGISTVDADGVALAAIQGLHALVKERDATIARQGEALARVQAELDELRTAVGRLLATAARR